MKEFALLHQTVLIQRKLTNGVVLGTRSFVFENDQAHSLIAVFVSRPFLKAFIWSGSAARQSRLISVLTFGNGNGGVVKGIEFSGSRARQPYWVFKRTRKVYNSVARRLGGLLVALTNEPPSHSSDTSLNWLTSHRGGRHGDLRCWCFSQCGDAVKKILISGVVVFSNPVFNGMRLRSFSKSLPEVNFLQNVTLRMYVGCIQP